MSSSRSAVPGAAGRVLPARPGARRIPVDPMSRGPCLWMCKLGSRQTRAVVGARRPIAAPHAQLEQDPTHHRLHRDNPSRRGTAPPGFAPDPHAHPRTYPARPAQGPQPSPEGPPSTRRLLQAPAPRVRRSHRDQRSHPPISPSPASVTARRSAPNRHTSLESPAGCPRG